MSATAGANHNSVDASPTKRFFVDMLTRDIELQDAVLDLLDNCVDGLMRSSGPYDSSAEKPYTGHWARITFSEDRFTIADNCGGISRKLAEDSAFRMGRVAAARVFDANIPTVGMYGIGMKRAIFKMGRRSTVTSNTKKEAFRVDIPESWFSKASEDDWKLPIKTLQPSPSSIGTSIEVSRLDPAVAKEFANPAGFAQTFRSTVSQQYSLIIEKGFQVFIDNRPVKPLPLEFRSVDLANYQEGIAPFMFSGKIDGVDVDMHVGFYKPIPDDAEIEAQDEGTFSADEAGWTVICNDRVVLYHDRTRLTGWGEASVPSFHNQFISISGVVHFRCNDATKLPVTTTKRGINASSDVYAQAKDKMRQGLKVFTSYTNQLKKDRTRRDEIFAETGTVDLRTLKQASSRPPATSWTQDRKFEGKTFVPQLPRVVDSNLKTIRFLRPQDQIAKVAQYVLDDPNAKPSEVGEECFDRLLKEAKRR
jgi:hypothetical protein